MISSEQIVSFVHSLEKHRKNIIIIILIPLILSVLTYFKTNYIFKLLCDPLNEVSLFFITPVEGVTTKIKVSLATGLALSFPILAYKIYSLINFKDFIKKKSWVRFFMIPLATLLFYGGIAFTYKFVMPVTVNFLLSTGNELMTPVISGSSYTSFILTLLFLVGLIFELPLFLVLLSKLGIVSYKKLKEKRKIAILMISIVVAIITPTPDAFTMIIVSAPMIVLYELGIWWIYVIERKKNKLQQKLDAILP